MVGSVAESFVVLVSPPPATVAVLVRLAAALLATLTVNVKPGKLALAATMLVLVAVFAFHRFEHDLLDGERGRKDVFLREIANAKLSAGAERSGIGGFDAGDQIREASGLRRRIVRARDQRPFKVGGLTRQTFFQKPGQGGTDSAQPA